MTDEEVRIEKGETKVIKCQVGEKSKSNLCNVLFVITDPFKPYTGYGHVRKKGGIVVPTNQP